MVRIAIAGGTGGLGRTLVDDLARGGEHDVFVMSRKSNLPFKPPPTVHCLAAPYDSVDELTKILDTNEISVVLSTLSPPTPEVHEAQDNLIRASAQSATVKRFIPSEWGIDWSYDDDHLPIPWKVLKRESLAELQKHTDKLEWTLVYNGYFMDYFGMPHCASHMNPETPYIDIPSLRAAIPGSGDEKVAWTYTHDVARYVRALIESAEPWPKTSLIVGDTMSLNAIVSIAEEIKAQKFDTVHDSLQELRAGNITEIPAYVPLYDIFPKEMVLNMMAGLGIGMVTGIFDLAGAAKGEGEMLNERFPEIRPVGMRAFIEGHWRGK